jgi:hypothetical protein
MQNKTENAQQRDRESAAEGGAACGAQGADAVELRCASVEG